MDRPVGVLEHLRKSRPWRQSLRGHIRGHLGKPGPSRQSIWGQLGKPDPERQSPGKAHFKEAEPSRQSWEALGTPWEALGMPWGALLGKDLGKTLEEPLERPPRIHVDREGPQPNFLLDGSIVTVVQ